MKTRTVRNWFAVGLLVALAAGAAVWYARRDTLPRPIRIATGEDGGLYRKFGENLAGHLPAGTVVRTTRGTVENCDLLRAGEADLAVVQMGACDTAGVASLAPLYRDVVHVVVRTDSDITKVGDLRGRSVSLGPVGSGMRESASQILSHYGVDPSALKNSDAYFLELREEGSPLEAAVVTTGMPNPDLGRLLQSGRFRLLPVDGGPALHVKHAYFTPVEIPRDLYAPGVPAEPVPTVATTAFLAARADAPDRLVYQSLDALYNDYQSAAFSRDGHAPPGEHPQIAPLESVNQWYVIPPHRAAVSYRDPYRGLELFGRFMEWIAALKEILLALAAGIYLTWVFWRNLKEREQEREFQAQKQVLDALLRKTIDIERAHMVTSDPRRLRAYLDQVTAIKLDALEQLTHDRLRGDRSFSIFLMQCSNVIRKIQEKCILHLTHPEIRAAQADGYGNGEASPADEAARPGLHG